MKHTLKLLFVFVVLCLASTRLLAGPPSIEMNIYPATTQADIKQIGDLIKEHKGKLKISKLVYKNNVLKMYFRYYNV